MHLRQQRLAKKTILLTVISASSLLETCFFTAPSAASTGAAVLRRLFWLTRSISCGLKAAPAAGRPAVSLPSESCVGWAKADGLLASPPAFSYLLPAYIVNGEASGFPDVLSSSTGFLGRVFFGGPRTPSRIFILLYIPGRLRPPEFSR